MRVALITGGNRGIGLATAYLLGRQGLQVVIGCRDPIRGARASHHLRKLGLEVESVLLQVDDAQSCRDAVHQVVARHGRIDSLVNNAGIFVDAGPALRARPDSIVRSFLTNALGPAMLMQAAVRPMLEQGYGRIVNVTSGMGSIRPGVKGSIGYRVSKAALNMLTAAFAQELAGTNVLVNAVCPGWVRTRITSGASTKPVVGADTAAWLATLPDGGPTGSLFRHREQVPW